MNGFDLQPEKQKRSPLLWNILTSLVLVGVICVAAVFVMIFLNPNVAFNPFPPPQLPTPLLFPTPTITPIQLPPTWTPGSTLEPTATLTRVPTWTPEPTNTVFLIPSIYTATKTKVPTKTPVPTGMPFAYTITYMESTYYHPEAGCNWMGVAGQVVDKNNSPILYITILLGGSLGDKSFIPSIPSLSGTSPNYGQSGFEFVLSDKPAASNGTLWIQLVDQANLPLTDKISINTYNDCLKNLVMIRFKKIR